jgi:hypothetical protein
MGIPRPFVLADARREENADLIKANVAAKKRKEDLVILLVDTSDNWHGRRCEGVVRRVACHDHVREASSTNNTAHSAATPRATTNRTMQDASTPPDSTSHIGFTVDRYTATADHRRA